jgi:signal transduction histidine kinase
MDLRPLWIGGGILLLIVAGLLIGGLWALNRQRTLHLASTRRWARRLLTAQDEAAAELARELHDDLLQQLQLVGWQASDPALKTEIGEIAGQLRGLAHNLHPAAIDDHPLDRVLQQLAAEWDAFSPPSVTFAMAGELPLLPVAVRRHLYRIAQQAVANARSHAAASEITLTLTVDPGWVILTVVDDGCGFTLGEAPANGLGLRSMAERIGSAGGSFQVESAPGKGTRIRAAWPRTGAKLI